MSLANKVLFITGASRGIGKAIALRAAQDGAKVVIAAKTKDPHPKLPGTIYTVADEIEKAGGKALPCVVDIRFEDQVEAAVDSAVKEFGSIDILVNNASAISLTNTSSTSMKTYDLMNGINARGTYLCSKVCLPHLKKSATKESPSHILNISPPLNMAPKWFSNHVAYTMAKYGMSMCVLGMASEFRSKHINVNALWPKTAIYTAAMQMLGGGDEIAKKCRKVDIMSDSAHAILTQNDGYTGNFLIDEVVLRNLKGQTDFDHYACEPGNELMPDFFLEDHDLQLKKDDTKPESESATSSSGGESEVESSIKKLMSLIDEEAVKKVKAVFLVEIDSPAGKSAFLINLKDGSGSYKPVADAAEVKKTLKPEVQLSLNSDNFLKLISGKLGAAGAFMSGKLKMKGDMGSAMKFDQLLQKMKSKL